MEIVRLVFDGLLLLFLSATMVFVWKLSSNINAFRRSRAELNQLVKDLSSQIEKADIAINGLKNTTKEGGRALQALIEEGRTLKDELQIMTESGDNLAARLERLADRNRDSAERIERAGGPASALKRDETPLKRVQESKRVPTGPAFAIRDRDIEAGDAESGFDDAAADASPLQSKAERELMEALRKGRVS